MLEVAFLVNTRGRVGSDFWSYSIDTPKGSTVIATAGYVDARLMHDHYLIMDRPSWDRPPIGIVDESQSDAADLKMREHLRKQLAHYVASNKNHRIAIMDNNQILGDLSDIIV